MAKNTAPDTKFRNAKSADKFVVDDMPDAAEALARLLQAMGCRTDFETDPSRAISGADRMRAEIVFLDIGMPAINGYELAEIFRRRYGNSVLLVAVTGYGDDQHHKRSRQAGFDADIQKPVAIGVLQGLLKSVLANRR